MQSNVISNPLEFLVATHAKHMQRGAVVMILLRDTDTETDSGPGSPMVRSFLAHQSEHHGQDSSVSA